MPYTPVSSYLWSLIIWNLTSHKLFLSTWSLHCRLGHPSRWTASNPILPHHRPGILGPTCLFAFVLPFGPLNYITRWATLQDTCCRLVLGKPHTRRILTLWLRAAWFIWTYKAHHLLPWRSHQSSQLRIRSWVGFIRSLVIQTWYANLLQLQLSGLRKISFFSQLSYTNLRPVINNPKSQWRFNLPLLLAPGKISSTVWKPRPSLGTNLQF